MIKKDQLFSTKPRLARSGSKTKLENSQSSPAEPSTGQTHNIDKIPRLNNPYVEVIGRGYADEKYPNRRLLNENSEDKQSTQNKPRAKILKGKSNSTNKQRGGCGERKKTQERHFHSI